MGSNNDFFYKLAISSSVLSAVSMIIIGLSVPFLYSKSSADWEIIQNKAEMFKENTNKMWSKLQIIQSGNVEIDLPASAIFFSRKPRAIYGQQVCSGCTQLNCPSGIAGLPGSPGEDGLPGESGLPGKPGEDGFDVELEPENDLPCIICPAGPQGQRGLQGERGQTGLKGLSGDEGLQGQQGDYGLPGLPGPRGKLGKKGNPGPPGPIGDTIVAGVGIPGPRGPRGPSGPKGPNGPPGRLSQNPGMPGKPGPTGPIGPYGNPGRPGEEGLTGPPGEPGQPAAYCPSDCGVSKILAPSIRPINEPKAPLNDEENKQLEVGATEEKNEQTHYFKN